VDHFVKLIENKTVAENSYNIGVSNYVDGKDNREVIDIKELNTKIAQIVKNQNNLRVAIDEIVNDIEGTSIAYDK